MTKKIFFVFQILLLSVVFLWGTLFLFLPLPGQVPVLMYHFVRDDAAAAHAKNNVAAQSLDRQLGFLRYFGYRVITLDELFQIQTGSRPARGREIAITFDDGNYTVAENALPVLEKYAFPVTLFLVSDSVKTQAHGSMGAETLERLLREKWITIGSHSRTHPILSGLSDEKLRNELEGSRKDLESLFGVPVYTLAYPSGDVDERVAAAAKKAGYRLAFTTSAKKGKGIDEKSRYALTRVKISRSSDNLLVFWVKVSGLYSFFKSITHRLKSGHAGMDLHPAPAYPA